MIGEVLGNRYELIEKIGEGGMAIVYKARDNKLSRLVAVKILKREFANNKDISDKFKKEATAVANFSDANIVNVLDVGHEEEGNIDYRRRMCFFYRYYSCLFNHDVDLALENTLEFNSKFIYPLSEREVIQASKSAEKAYDEWLSNKAEDFKKPVWNKETGTYNIKGYNYKNTSIIRDLDITEEEQMQMSTIISKKEKKRRQCKKEYDDRRNENGLTESKQKQLNLYFQILELREIDSTMSIRNIADELKTTKSKVETALKNWSNVDVSDFKRTYM